MRYILQQGQRVSLDLAFPLPPGEELLSVAFRLFLVLPGPGREVHKAQRRPAAVGLVGVRPVYDHAVMSEQVSGPGTHRHFPFQVLVRVVRYAL